MVFILPKTLCVLQSEASLDFAMCPLSGDSKWIRTPAIIYSTHVATTLVPILAHILFYQFPVKPHLGPQTPQERWLLVSVYAPYLLIPVVILLTMLLSSTYNSTSKSGHISAKIKKNWHITRLHLFYLIWFWKIFSTYLFYVIYIYLRSCVSRMLHYRDV